MRVTFYGGPWDGEERDVHPEHHEIRLPLPFRVSILDRGETPAACCPPRRIGVYHRAYGAVTFRYRERVA